MADVYPRVRPEVITRKLGDEFVVYDPVTDCTALLNATAAATLDLCDGTRSVDAIVREVARAFGVDAARIDAEIRSTIEGFRHNGLIERDGANARP